MVYNKQKLKLIIISSRKNKEQDEEDRGLLLTSSSSSVPSQNIVDVVMEDCDDELEEGEIREDDDENDDDDDVMKEEVVVKKEEVEIEASNKKVCPECGKEFNGGKALGGHLRIHKNGPKNRPESESDMADPDHSGGEHICNRCGKVFHSIKALHGHMRSHPEREYRGMQEPGLSSGSGSSSGLSLGKEIPVEDLLWKAKAKRTPKIRVDEAAEALLLSCSEDEMVVAEVLCNFAKYARINSSDGDVMRNHSPINSDCCVASTSYSKKARKSDDDFNAGVKQNNNNNNNNNNKRMKPFDLNDVYVEEEDTLKLKREWVCSTCNKTFSSYRALGGHMSSTSHNKHKAAAAAAGGGGGGDQGATPTQYKCKKCEQSFPTRQGLGGHQSCHNHHGVSLLLSSSEPVRSQFTEAAPTPPAPRETVVLDFDLNLMPEDIE